MTTGILVLRSSALRNLNEETTTYAACRSAEAEHALVPLVLKAVRHSPVAPGLEVGNMQASCKL